MIRMSGAEALVRFLAAQEIEHRGQRIPLFGGVWAIFGHGNVGGLGQALGAARGRLPVFRGHNEQGMGHAALGFAKAWRRRRAMAVTTSIGPGATNLVTAAATGHVNRLPMLLLPADVFADRRPDPVLQQLEHPLGLDWGVNECLRPVSRFFDRVTRPEQLLVSLPEAVRVLTDPASAGPVTVSICQDVQAESGAFPPGFFAHRLHRLRRMPPDPEAVAEAATRLASAERVLVIAGGGVRYAMAETTLRRIAEARGWPVAMTQAGKGALPDDHPLCLGGVGVTGTSAANSALKEADVALLVGTRATDFTTGSGRLLGRGDLAVVGLNVDGRDAARRGGFPVVGDALLGLELLGSALAGTGRADAWADRATGLREAWRAEVEAAREALGPPSPAPSDAEVLLALARRLGSDATVVAAAGGIPGDLHKLWPAANTDAYLVEYGYSCMGHEIAGALGVKQASPDREVWSLLGDGSYLMLSSELATSVSMDLPLRVLVLDNRGFGCIDRLDQAIRCGSKGVTGNLREEPAIDIAAHAAALGAASRRVEFSELDEGIEWARSQAQSTVLVVETDPGRVIAVGGAPWRVPALGTGGR